MSLDSTVFRRVIGNFMSGVVVITTSVDGVRHGMTVSAVSSLSLDPPMLLVCLNTASGTQQAVRDAGRFAVNVLAEDQAHLAERFARPGGPADKFGGLAVDIGVTGVPVLGGALAVLECEITETVPGGTHLVFLSRVVHAAANEGAPLAYFRGSFGKIEIASDAMTYQRLRGLVLTRGFRPDEVLDVSALAAQLGVAETSVFYGLTRLVADNLVIRDPDRGHVVRPVDEAVSDDVHNAKMALELGVADLTVGRLCDAQLDQFAMLAEATADQLSGGHFVEVGAYISANDEFHRYPVQCTEVAALLEAYDRLSLPEIMSRTLSADFEVSPQMVDDHRGLVTAYRNGDLVAAKAIITAHTERAKATQRTAIELHGGRL